MYIIGIIDGHRHENKFKKEVDYPPSSLSNIPTHYYCFVVHTTHSYITIKTAEEGEWQRVLVIVELSSSFHHTIYN